MKTHSKNKWDKIEEEAHRAHLAETYGGQRRNVMIKLDEYNKQVMETYELEPVRWRKGVLACPKCEVEVAMLEQVGVILTSHPPKVKVRCPECKLESYKII